MYDQRWHCFHQLNLTLFPRLHSLIWRNLNRSLIFKTILIYLKYLLINYSKIWVGGVRRSPTHVQTWATCYQLSPQRWKVGWYHQLSSDRLTTPTPVRLHTYLRVHCTLVYIAHFSSAQRMCNVHRFYCTVLHGVRHGGGQGGHGSPSQERIGGGPVMHLPPPHFLGKFCYETQLMYSVFLWNTGNAWNSVMHA